MFKVLSTIVIVIVAGIVIGTSASHFANKGGGEQVLSTQTQVAQQQKNAMPGVPVHISIPSINVDTEIESVAMDSKGRMDVPKDSDNTAWFNPGYRPGQAGSAVIDGHYDKADGSPAAFWNINKLKPGDKIIVTDDNGQKKTFAVMQSIKYPDANFPIQKVFGQSNDALLNLITCQGTWDKAAHNYSDRMVVYSKLVE